MLLTSLVMIIWHTRYLCGAHIRNQWISQHVFIEFIYVHGRLLSEEKGISGGKFIAIVLNFADEKKPHKTQKLMA